MPIDNLNLYPDSPLPRISSRNRNGEPDQIVTTYGYTIDRDESATTHDGEVYRQDEVCSCEECGSIHHQDSDELACVYPDNGRCTPDPSGVRCENCRTTCGDCNREFESLSAENASGTAICQRCAENYYTCDSCDCIIHADRTHSDGEDGIYCRSCHNARVADRESDDDSESDSPLPRIRDYSYKPSPVFYPAFIPGTAYYGLEIECEDKKSYGPSVGMRDCGLPDMPEFYVKDDGSLDNGMEIVSHPGTFAHWQSHSFAFADKLRQFGFRAYDTSTCGLHIHISKSILTAGQITRLLAFARDNMDFMFFLSRRKEKASMTRYCELKDGTLKGLRAFAKAKLSDSAFDAELLAWTTEKGYGYTSVKQIPSSIRRDWERGQRYTALNTLNPHTIEFRIFRGTLNVESIKRNVAITAALVHYAKSPVARRYDSLTVDRFTDWLIASGAGIVGADMNAKLLSWVGSFKRGEIRPDSETA